MQKKIFNLILVVLLFSIIDIFIVWRFLNLRRIPGNGQAVNGEIIKYKAAGKFRYFTVRYGYKDKIYIKLIQVSHAVYNKYKDQRIMKVHLLKDNPNLITWEGDRLLYLLILCFLLVTSIIVEMITRIIKQL